MPSLTGYVDNTGSEGYAHWQMLETIRRFACGFGTLAAPTFAGTGNGAMGSRDTYPATVTETWTIKCTSATTAGSEVWSVTGSVSGAKANATTGVAYDNGLIKFTIAAGGAAFAVNDTFTLNATQGALSAIGRAWVQLRYLNPNDITQTRELILQGSGLSGTDQIFVGIRTYQSVSADYYNLSVATFKGYVAGNTFATQPGASLLSGIPAHNLRIDYWLRVTGQVITFALKVGTPVYECGQVGRFYQLDVPGQYPQPLVAAGMLSGESATRYSDVNHSMPWKGSRANLQMNFNDGVWHQPAAYPWSNGTAANAVRDTGGNYHLTPVVMHDNTPNVYGYLDGIYHITGFNNVVENTLTINGVNYVVIQDVSRTSFGDYFAMELD